MKQFYDYVYNELGYLMKIIQAHFMLRSYTFAENCSVYKMKSNHFIKDFESFSKRLQHFKLDRVFNKQKNHKLERIFQPQISIKIFYLNSIRMRNKIMLIFYQIS